MAIEAVVFDLDGTLAVPERDRTTLLREAVAAVGAPPLSRDRYLEAHRADHQHETREPIFEAILAEHDTDVEASALAAAYRRLVAEAVRPVAGVEAMFDRLEAAGYRLGLLTNGPTKAQTEKLARLGWEDRFDAVVVTGRLPAGKPAAGAFEAVLTELGVAAADAVYVGDEVEMDVLGASRAGMLAIQVCYDGGPPPDERAITHVERDTLATDLPTVLEGLAVLEGEPIDRRLL